MSIVTALLLSLVAAGGEALTPQELSVAVASFEEAVSSQTSLIVSYRTSFEWTKLGVAEIQRPALQNTVCSWKRSGGKEVFVESLDRTPSVLQTKWIYDLTTTNEWLTVGDTGRSNSVGVNRGPPRPAIKMQNELAFLLGWERWGIEGGLVNDLKDASQHNAISGVRINDRFEITLPMRHSDNKSDVVLLLDPLHEHRLAAWYVQNHTDTEQDRRGYEYVVDEFQQVADHSSGSKVWFPLRAHYGNPYSITKLEIDSVQINPTIPDGEFALPQLPPGTKLLEASTIPGGLPRVSVVGGKIANQERLDELAVKSKSELQRLEQEGVVFDATPHTTSLSLVWLVFGCGLLLIAGMSWLRRRT